MSAYFVRRLWQTIPTFAGVLLLVFVLFRVWGGDPAVVLGGLGASPQQIDAIRQQLGLERPWPEQFARFTWQALTFDWGRSWATNEPVAQLLATRLPATLTVMLPIVVLETLLALPLAMWTAHRRGRASDRLLTACTTVALSISFLVVIVVGQYLFAFRLGWFPVQGWSESVADNLVRYAPLPVLLAVLVGLAAQSRLYRSVVLEELEQDHVRTARAKGLGEARVMLRHVLPNVLIPVLTNVGQQLPSAFVGSFLIEVYFSIPGIGREVLLAVNRSDFPVIQAVTVNLAALTMLVNLATDFAYALVDPRVVLR